MIDPRDLNRQPEWWAGYADGHADGTAEAQLLIDAAARAGEHHGRRYERLTIDAEYQAGPTDIRSCIHFLEYLAQDAAATPGAIPPLDRSRRPAS